jgi:hypothetical protein
VLLANVPDQVALDTPARTAASFAIIDELTRVHGLVTSEMVPAAGPMAGPPGALSMAPPR